LTRPKVEKLFAEHTAKNQSLPDHFGCLLLNSSLQIFDCSSNALGIVETILPSPESHRSFFPVFTSSSVLRRIAFGRIHGISAHQIPEKRWG
jgi:hypothetical protein